MRNFEIRFNKKKKRDHTVKQEIDIWADLFSIVSNTVDKNLP